MSDDASRGHPYPPNHGRGAHWATDAAWDILDGLPVGQLTAEQRFLAAGQIAGALIKAARDARREAATAPRVRDPDHSRSPRFGYSDDLRLGGGFEVRACTCGLIHADVYDETETIFVVNALSGAECDLLIGALIRARLKLLARAAAAGTNDAIGECEGSA